MKTKHVSYLSPIDSLCMHCFFLNLSDSPLPYSLLMHCPYVSFFALARWRLDCSCSILALVRSFSHLDRLLVEPVATLLHFDTCEISFTHQSPSDQTTTTLLVVRGQEHWNCAHALKVWWIYIYIHTNMNWLHCTISSLTLKHLALRVISPVSPLMH